jgi:hypothetical protein
MRGLAARPASPWSFRELNVHDLRLKKEGRMLLFEFVEGDGRDAD